MPAILLDAPVRFGTGHEMRISKPSSESWFWIAYLILGVVHFAWIFSSSSRVIDDIIWISVSLLVFWKPSQKLLDTLDFLWIVPLVMVAGWIVADAYFLCNTKEDFGGKLGDLLIANGFSLSWEILMAILARWYVKWLED